MYRLFTTAVLCLFFSTPSFALVTYAWSPFTPSNEGYHYEGFVKITDKAFFKGSAKLELVLCDALPETPCLSASNTGIVEYFFSYNDVGGYSVLSDSRPDLTTPFETNDLYISVVPSGDTAKVSLDYFGFYTEFETSGNELYVLGDDFEGSCGYYPETRILCRGSTGEWVRVPEPPVLALFILTLGAIWMYRRSADGNDKVN